MNTPNTVTLPTNIYELTAYQILRLVSSRDIDSAEFGTRFVLYLNLVAKNDRTADEQAYMVTLMRAVAHDYTNVAFREHLQETLRGREVA